MKTSSIKWYADLGSVRERMIKMMPKELSDRYYELCELSEKEATKLYRLAWRMEDHGCDEKNIQKCREEASRLHLNAYPWQLLDPSAFQQWLYAFKF